MITSASTPTVTVGGNVGGSIISGDHNFVVDTNNGTITYQQVVPPKLHNMVPKPPLRVIHFVGRAHELTELERFVRDRQSVVLYGIDGLGKTALVRQVANSDAARAFPHGVVYLQGRDEKGTAIGLGDIRQLLFDALYESVPPLKVNAASAPTYLSNTNPLVVLDHLSLPSEALRSLADLFPNGTVITACPQPVVVDTLQSLKLGPLSRSESIELFAFKINLTVDDSNRATLDALCASLGDVPAALVMVANGILCKNVPLDKAYHFVTTANPSSTDAIQAGLVRANTFVLSLLSPEEQEAYHNRLRLVAAAPGRSVGRELVEKWAGGSAVNDALVCLGLLQTNSPRLRISPDLREAIMVGVDETAAKEQLLTYLLQELATRSLDFDLISDELGNILGLHEWAFTNQRWADVIAIGRAIDPYLTLRGLWDAWHTVLDRVLQAARAISDPLVEGWALHQLGTREIGAGEKAQAVALLEQALALRQSIDDVVGAAYTQHNLDLLIPPPLPPEKLDQPPKPPNGNKPNPTSGWPWRIFAFLLAGVVMVGIIGAVIVDWPRPTPPPPSPIPPQLDFIADRGYVDPGQCTVLRWTVHHADWVKLNGNNVNYSDQIRVCPDETTRYKLVAGGGPGAIKELQVIVRTPTPSPLFSPSQTPTPSATPSQIPTWTETPTPSVTPSHTPTKTWTPTPTRTSTPTPTFTITMTPCPGPPVIQSFSASPSTITAGGKSTLSWGPVSYATRAEIDQGIGGVGTPGQVIVSPKTTTTYTLTAIGCDGTTTSQVKVSVFYVPIFVLPVDTTGPSITAVSATPNPIYIDNGYCPPNTPMSTTIKATVNDPSGVGGVWLRYRTKYGSSASTWKSATMIASGNVYQESIDASSLNGNTWTIEYYIRAWDKLGNETDSSTASVDVNTCLY